MTNHMRERDPRHPLLSTSHPPDPRRSWEGRAINNRGVGGIPFLWPRTRDSQKEEEEEEEDDDDDDDDELDSESPGPLQITQGQDQQ